MHAMFQHDTSICLLEFLPTASKGSFFCTHSGCASHCRSVIMWQRRECYRRVRPHCERIEVLNIRTTGSSADMLSKTRPRTSTDVTVVEMLSVAPSAGCYAVLREADCIIGTENDNDLWLEVCLDGRCEGLPDFVLCPQATPVELHLSSIVTHEILDVEQMSISVLLERFGFVHPNVRFVVETLLAGADVEIMLGWRACQMREVRPHLWKADEVDEDETEQSEASSDSSSDAVDVD